MHKFPKHLNWFVIDRLTDRQTDRQTDRLVPVEITDVRIPYQQGSMDDEHKGQQHRMRDKQTQCGKVQA